MASVRQQTITVLDKNVTKAMEMIRDGYVLAVGKTAEGLLAVEYLSMAGNSRCVMVINPGNNEVTHFCDAVKVHTTSRNSPCWHLGLALKIIDRSASTPAKLTNMLEEAKGVEVVEDLSPTYLGKRGQFQQIKLVSAGSTAKPAPASGSTTNNSVPTTNIIDPKITEEVVNDLLNRGVAPGLVEDLVEFRNKLNFPPEIFHRIATKGRYVGTKVLSLCLGSLLEGKNILTHGPKGCGKTVLMESLSYYTGLPMYTFMGHNQVEVAQMLADKTLTRDQSGRANVGYEIGLVVEAVKAGGLLFLDEFTGIPSGVMMALHPLLDHRREVEVPGFGKVQAADTFRFVGAGNIGYEGTFDTNPAALDRCFCLDLGYNSEIAEIILAESKLEDRSIAEKLEKLFKDILIKVESGDVSDTALTIRGLIDAADLMAKAKRWGLDIKDIVDMAVVGKLQNDDVAKTEVRDCLEGIFA
jgi:MoxR-like ATPase